MPGNFKIDELSQLRQFSEERRILLQKHRSANPENWWLFSRRNFITVACD
jgi:hypothetical protein